MPRKIAEAKSRSWRIKKKTSLAWILGTEYNKKIQHQKVGDTKSSFKRRIKNSDPGTNDSWLKS